MWSPGCGSLLRLGFRVVTVNRQRIPLHNRLCVRGCSVSPQPVFYSLNDSGNGHNDSPSAPSQSEVPPKTSSQPVLTLTDTCVRRLQQLQTDGSVLRVSVDSGGCSGFQYAFTFDKKIKTGDSVVERDGVKVVVDEISLNFLRGCTVDYTEELIRSSFRILQNPHAEKGCSCGSSFTAKV